MAWLSRNNWNGTDYVQASDLNNLANDDRAWGGDVNGGGHKLANVILDIGSVGFAGILSPIVVNTAPDNTAQVQLTGPGTTHPLRWAMVQDGVAETGGNAGSNFKISRYNDAGVLIDSPITINRATGAVTIAGGISGYVPTSRQVIAGSGLSGGGALSADVTLTLALTPALISAASGVVTTGSYPNPAWITSLAASKLTGSPPAATIAASQTPWLQNIDGGNFQVANVSKIGIGTTSPLALLDIPAIQTNAIARFGTLECYTEGINNAYLTENLLFNGAWVYRAGGAGGMLSYYNGDVRILTAPAGSANASATLTDRFHILNTGNVGIANSNPSYKLDVTGDINATGAIRLNGTPIVTSVSGLGGAVALVASTGISISPSGQNLNIGNSGVLSISPGTLSGAVTLAAGANVTVTQTGQTITIASSAPASSANYWVNGTLVAAQPTVNFLNGANVTITGVNNTGANRVDITIASSGAGSATPAGSDQQIQINRAGVFGADAGLTFDYTNKILTIAGTSTPARLNLTTDGSGGYAHITGFSYSGAATNFGGIFRGYSARGSGAAATLSKAGDYFVIVQGFGHTGSAFQIGGGINVTAESDWSATNTAGFIQFNTGSGSASYTERMRITSAGNVGIGTASPVTLLHVQGAVAAGRMNVNFENNAALNTACRVRLKLGPVSNFIGTDFHPYIEAAWVGPDNADLAFGTYVTSNVNERMRITSAGNVGIGTASPAQRLHILGLGSDPSPIGLIESWNGGAVPAWQAQNVNGVGIQIGSYGNDNRTWLFAVKAASTNPSALVIGGNTGVTIPIIFAVNQTTELMRITSAGNVGIGTTSPNALLQLGAGTPTTAGAQCDIYQANQTATSGIANLRIFTTDALALDKGGSLALGGISGVTTANMMASIAGRSENNSYAGYFQVCTVNSAGTILERMRITSGGNVGIGLTNPQQKLEINGAATSLAATGSWIDSNVMAVAGCFYFFRNSDTSISLRMRGSDGYWRQATFTLA